MIDVCLQRFSPVIFADRSKTVLLLWILFANCFSCLSLFCCLVCPCSLMVTCCNTFDLLALLYAVFFWFCYFPICVLIHTRTNGAVGTVTPVFILTDRPRRCFFWGSFLSFMFHICLCYAVLSVRCNIVITYWERADLLNLLFVLFACIYGCPGSGMELDCIDSWSLQHRPSLNRLSRCVRFPTVWHCDMCGLGRASAASF